MSFKSWIAGVLSAVLDFMLPLLKSKVADLIADKEVQALAIQAVKLQAESFNNSDDDRHQIATMQLRQDLKAKGREIALGVASTIIEACYQKLKAEGEVIKK